MIFLSKIIPSYRVLVLIQLLVDKHADLHHAQTAFIHSSEYKKVGVLPIRTVYSNVLSVGPSSERKWAVSL